MSNPGNYQGSFDDLTAGRTSAEATLSDLNRPSVPLRGVSGLDPVFHSEGALASTLGSGFDSQPSNPSPLGQGSVSFNDVPSTLGRQAFGSGSTEPTPLSQPPVTGPGSASSNSAGITGLSSQLPTSSGYTSTASEFNTTQKPSTLTGSNVDNTPSSTYQSSKDSTPTSAGFSPVNLGKIAPETQKSEDHVSNLATALGGVILTAPLAAVEALSGHAANAANQAKSAADERGITGLASSIGEQVSGVTAQAQPYLNKASETVSPYLQSATDSLSGAATQAQQKLNAAQDPNNPTPSIQDTVSSYASSAAATAQGLASRVGLGNREQAADTANQVSNAASQNANAAANTASSYTSSAGATLSNLASSAQQSVRQIGERVGLVSPTSATSSSNVTGTSSDQAALSSSGTSSAFGGSSQATYENAAKDHLTGSSAQTYTTRAGGDDDLQLNSTGNSSAFGGSAQASYENSANDRGVPPSFGLERDNQGLSQPGSASYGQGTTGYSNQSGVQQ